MQQNSLIALSMERVGESEWEKREREWTAESQEGVWSGQRNTFLLRVTVNCTYTHAYAYSHSTSNNYFVYVRNFLFINDIYTLDGKYTKLRNPFPSSYKKAKVVVEIELQCILHSPRAEGESFKAVIKLCELKQDAVKGPIDYLLPNNFELSRNGAVLLPISFPPFSFLAFCCQHFTFPLFILFLFLYLSSLVPSLRVERSLDLRGQVLKSFADSLNGVGRKRGLQTRVSASFRSMFGEFSRI